MAPGKTPIRLPPLQKLRVHQPNKPQVNPCVTVMSSVLACWASAGSTIQGCSAVEQALRSCMDGPAPKAKPKNNINYHLSRMKKQIQGAQKRR